MSDRKPNTSEEARSCPLCGQANHCQPAATGSFSVDCWCRHETMPSAILRQTMAGNERCICQRCAQQLSKENREP